MKYTDYVKLWFELAAADLQTAQLIFDSNQPLYHNVGFHLQQACEKYLKGLLAFHKIHFAKTHDENELLSMAAAISNGFELIDMKDINSFAVEIRYPDDFFETSKQEIELYFKLTLHLKSLVESFVTN
jgi:HEPN domain-containing protein